MNAVEIARIVRKRSACPIVWGGVHPTVEQDSTIASEWVDIIVVGEGEETFCDLVETLRKKKPLDTVNGIIFKQNGRARKTPARGCYDLDKLPMLPLNLVNLTHYKEHFGLTRYFRFSSPVAVSIETSRGCTHRCTYCVMASKEYAARAKWRGMSAVKVADVVQEIMGKYGIHAFAFVDDNFFVDMARVLDFLEEIERRPLNIEWFADIRMDTIVKNMDIPLLKRLESSGLRSVSVGIESGSNRMLKYLRKGETRETYIEANKMLVATRIVPQYGFILGLPTERREDVEQSYALAVQLLKDNPNAAPTMNKLLPTPGTPLLEECVKHGFCPPDKLEDWVDYCDTKWKRGPTVWMDKDAARFIISQIYFHDLLTMVTAKPNKGRLQKFLLDCATRLLLLRIKKQFHSMRIEQAIHRLIRIPILFRFIKRAYIFYLRSIKRPSGQASAKQVGAALE